MTIKSVLFFKLIIICLLLVFVSSYPSGVEKNGSNYVEIIDKVKDPESGKYKAKEKISKGFIELKDRIQTPVGHRWLISIYDNNEIQSSGGVPGIYIQGLYTNGISMSNNKISQGKSSNDKQNLDGSKLKELSGEDNSTSNEKDDENSCAVYDSTKKKCLSYRIVGGKAAQISDFPYTVNYDRYCGGSILSKNWVITAAHCGDEGIEINVGSTRLGGGTYYKIKRHIIHPNYDEKSFDFDFQLLEMKTPILLNENAKPICIGTEKDIVPGKLATITGWGAAKEGGYMAQLLMSAEIPIIDSDKCVLNIGEYRYPITPRMICVGFKDGKVDSCQGDSGGPLMINNKLIGVVSFGFGCARANTPGMYGNVVHVKKWIQKLTNTNDNQTFCN